MRLTSATMRAEGHLARGLRQFAVRVTDDMYAELKMRALQENRSIAAQTLDYIECGLAVDRDWDEDRKAEGQPPKTLVKAIEEGMDGWFKDSDGTFTRIKRSVGETVIEAKK